MIFEVNYRYETSRGLFATAELPVTHYFRRIFTGLSCH